MNSLKVLICTSAALWAFQAGAQGSSTLSTNSTSSSDSKSTMKLDLHNKKFEDSREITDAKLRADAGSLSKYSLKFNLSYYGPTVGDLGAKDQPNPDAAIGPSQTAISGTVGMRYRTASNRSISFGTGIKGIHPFHGMERFDVQTPYLAYDLTSRTASGVQIRHSPSVTYVTLPEYKAVGEVGTVGYDFNSIYNLGASRWAVGMDASISYFIYNRPYEASDRKASRGSLSVYPTAKYNFSDKLSMTTSTSLSWLAPRYRSNESVLLNRAVTQRIGLGYALSRDIYLFPYINVYPVKAAWDTTTLNFSTSFSIL